MNERAKTDYKFTKGFTLSRHAAERLEERTKFTVIQLLRMLYQKQYSKLSMQKKVNLPRHELDLLVRETALTFKELVINSMVEFDTFVYFLVWSEADDKYFIVILKELENTWLVLTIIPSSYLVQFNEEDNAKKYYRAKHRILNGRPVVPTRPAFRRYVIVIVWKQLDGKVNIKSRNLKYSIESYSPSIDFMDIAISVTEGIRPDSITVRSRADIDDIFWELDLSYLD